MGKDNLSSQAYYHFISFVKEICGKQETLIFVKDVQHILENIEYKNKSYSDILIECGVLPIFNKNEEEN